MEHPVKYTGMRGEEKKVFHSVSKHFEPHTHLIGNVLRMSCTTIDGASPCVTVKSNQSFIISALNSYVFNAFNQVATQQIWGHVVFQQLINLAMMVPFVTGLAFPNDSNDPTCEKHMNMNMCGSCFIGAVRSHIIPSLDDEWNINYPKMYFW